MENCKKVPPKKELIVRRICASKYEVYENSYPNPSPQVEEKEGKKIKESNEVVTEKTKNSQKILENETGMLRQTVIRKAPPRTENPNDNEGSSAPFGLKRKKTENMETNYQKRSVILIKDAIIYRILDILMWKVLGEEQLKIFGYPSASTCQLLLRALHQHSLQQDNKNMACEKFPQDHDCKGNIACFTNHVYQFLEIFVPNLWRRNEWAKLSVEEILRKIYLADLIPYLQNVDFRNNANILQYHSDIVLLEKWEKQKFTAVTWSDQSRTCPQCP